MNCTEKAERPNDCDVDKVSVVNLKSLELLWKSGDGFSDVLRSFRECHDLCAKSKLFGDDVVLKVDQCAVDFRQLSLETASVAKRVSNQWLDMALMAFESLSEMEDSAKNEMNELFKLLGNQAKELSYCFKIFAAWANDVSGRFHIAQDGTIREAEAFKKAFEDAIEEGEAILEALKKEQEMVSKYREECGTSKSTWTFKLSETHTSSPYRLLMTRLVCSAENRTLDAKKSEQIVANDLKKIEKDLEERKDQHGEAQVYIYINNDSWLH